MANAKKLTEPQVRALRAAAKEQVYARNPISRAWTGAVLDALERRGLIGRAPNSTKLEGYHYVITSAGRQALFEATGENTAASKAEVKALGDSAGVRAEVAASYTCTGCGLRWGFAAGAKNRADTSCPGCGSPSTPMEPVL